MSDAILKFPGQEPVDQQYARFRDGWDLFIVSKNQYSGLRWSPAEGQGSWRHYAVDEFDFIDFGVSGPASPLDGYWSFDAPQGYRFKWGNFFVPTWKLPDLWREVTATFDRVRAERPAAVWNPYDGSWRDVRSRYPVPPRSGGTSTGDTPPPTPPGQPELARRLDELLELYRQGKITDEILKQRTLELTREYG